MITWWGLLIFIGLVFFFFHRVNVETEILKNAVEEESTPLPPKPKARKPKAKITKKHLSLIVTDEELSDLDNMFK